MGMAVSKVRQLAPALAETFETTGRMLTSKGIRPNRDQAAVRIYSDHSGSTEDRYANQHLYTRRDPSLGNKSAMQYATEFGVAGGLFFDDDGSIPVNIFDTQVTPLGVATVENYAQVLDRHGQYGYGGTSYICVFKHVLQECGYGDLDLGTTRQRLSVKATAPYPTYVQVNTDGEPQSDSEDDVLEWIILMSQLPIFWQFVGLGNHKFRLLKRLDTLRGRLIDNAGFFDMKDRKARTVQGFSELMLGEFASSYYPGGRQLGMITS